MDVTGRTVLITGASSGLGAHFARLFASRKANVIVGARRIDRVETLAGELQAAGHSALAVALDVTDESSVSRAFDAGEARFGLIDTIIANAGLSVPGRATDVAIDDIRKLSDTNFTGAYLTAREGARRRRPSRLLRCRSV